MKQMIIPK